METKRTVNSKGTPLALTGTPVKAGDKAPDFTVLDNDMKPVTLSSFHGKTVVISSVMSLDTSVCDLQTRRFNQDATGLGENVVVLTISMDLPFAQKRWCGTAGMDRVITLSDHREASFGKAYGLLIDELRLLARAVLVIDPEGMVRYVQLVEETSNEPAYEPVMDAVKSLA